MKKIILQLALATCACITCRSQIVAVPAPLPHSKHSFIVVAHRGDHTHVPENTLASIREAIRCGVDYVEIDLRTTKDGYLVLSHDGSVERMTGSKGNIKDLTLAEIKQLKVTSPDSSSGIIYRIPEFRDVLWLCKGRMNIYLDFKDADVGQTWSQIQEASMERRVVVYLNKPEQYHLWREAAPRMPLMTSLPDNAKTPEEAARFLQKKPVEVLDNVYDTTLLSVTRQYGVAVWLDVQSDKEGPAAWEKVLGNGIQGMQTDHPEALVAYLRRKP
jgi:glycerophosphoryl diester phosphodiesterase